MLKRVGRLLAVAVVGLVAAATFASPANAVVELYQHASYGGGYWGGYDNYTYHNGDTFNNGYRLYDAVTSIQNDVPYWTCFYTNHYYTGEWLALPANFHKPNVGSYWNDRFSSHNYAC